MPFVTIEAEDVQVEGVVRMLQLPERTTTTPELEASGRAFVQLDGAVSVLTLPGVPHCNTFVIRHCLPDAREGGGLGGVLQVLVDQKLLAELELSSKHNWLYGAAGQNGQSNDPEAGSPHVFWDETRFVLPREIPAGSTVQLKFVPSEEVPYCRIDCIDLELAPDARSQPDGSLSVVSFGAMGDDNRDDTEAIAACIQSAKAQGKAVWLPAGTFLQSEKFVLDGVPLSGAGIWHTRLICPVDESKDGFRGICGFVLKGDGAAVSHLFIEAPLHTHRNTPGGRPFTGEVGDCTNWTVEHVWITHVHGGFWMSGCNHGLIRHCRVRQTYADGINLNRGSSDNVIENNHVRGTGDDGIALLSEKERTPNPSARNVVRNNTVSAVWWGHNLDLAGGDDHRIENNLATDNAYFGGLTINLPGAYPMYPLRNSTLARNQIVRGGGNFVGQRRGAVWIFAGDTNIENVTFLDNEIRDPLFRGFHLTGKGQQSIHFQGNVITNPGQVAFIIAGFVQGKGTFSNNQVKNLPENAQAFVNDTQADTYAVELIGNSWQ